MEGGGALDWTPSILVNFNFPPAHIYYVPPTQHSLTSNGQTLPPSLLMIRKTPSTENSSGTAALEMSTPAPSYTSSPKSDTCTYTENRPPHLSMPSRNPLCGAPYGALRSPQCSAATATPSHYALTLSAAISLPAPFATGVQCNSSWLTFILTQSESSASGSVTRCSSIFMSRTIHSCAAMPQPWLPQDLGVSSIGTCQEVEGA